MFCYVVFKHFLVSIILCFFLSSPRFFLKFLYIRSLLSCCSADNVCLNSLSCIWWLRFDRTLSFCNVQLNFCTRISLFNSISVYFSMARGYAHQFKSHTHTHTHWLLVVGRKSRHCTGDWPGAKIDTLRTSYKNFHLFT